MGESKRRRQVVVGVADATEFDHVVDNYGHVIIAVPRKDVERMEVGRTVSALMALSDSEQRVNRFADNLILSIDGYNADPRELWQINECVAFFAAVHAQWPYWFHFLVKHRDQFGFVLKMLAQQRLVESAGGGNTLPPQVPSNSMDGRTLGQVLCCLFASMNTLYDAYGIGIAENKLMTNKITAVVESLFA